MSRSRSLRRARSRSLNSVVPLVLGTTLTLTGLQLFAAPQADAASTSLVINEIYLNGGSAGATYTNKYVEIRNLTGSPVGLGGKSVQYRAATSAGSSTGVVALTGTVPANGYFVLVGASNGAAGVAVPNQNQQSSGYNPAAGGGTTTLVNATTAVDPSSSSAVIDKIGTGSGASASNTPEGSAVTGNSVTRSLGRTGPSTDTDRNAADFAVQDPTPGMPNPGSSTGGGTTTLTATNPGDQSAVKGQPITPLTLQASGGTTPYSWTATGLPDGLTVTTDGTVSGMPTRAGSFSATASVTDSASPSATASTTFTYTVTSNDPIAIADVQGTGATTPLSGQTVTTQGVVTASYPTGGLKGFYLQTPGPDTTPDASDGIFVYGGTSGFSTYPAVGDSVRVTGTAGEFSGQTQITATDAGIAGSTTSLGSVTPKTVIPGTDCALPGDVCLTGSALDAAREKVEDEAFAPTGAFTATDVYDGGPALNDGTNSSSNFGEIGLAAQSSIPLVAPTELYDAQDQQPQIANRTAYNQAHRIILDDGSATNYTASANTGMPVPWLSRTYDTRVSAAVTFPAPVVLGYGFGTWVVEPTSQVVGAPSSTQPQFAQTRTDNAAPKPVGGDVELATFNVLNFFPTTGAEYVGSGLGSCTYYSDRAGNRITTNSCGAPSTSSGNGPRGAADDVNLTRQRDKIVAAINGSGADIVSLEELENSVKFGKDRDFAIGTLVDALNVAAGAGTWDFVPSPDAGQLPAVADQDVIRTGFIYRPATITPVGASRVLADQSTGTGTFANAREPLAQAFKEKGTPAKGAFAVVVNHFKSKGSGTDDGTGQGNANPDRVAQARSLVTFAQQFQADRGLTRTFLVGDFNAYSSEDPIQVLEDAGYTNLDSTTNPTEESYNFDGQIGSLDHVLANTAAAGAVTGVDVWEINANEPVYREYSRYNYNVTDLYDATPFRSSDHNPEVVGIDASARTATTTTATDQTVTEGSTAQVPVTVAAASGSDVPTGAVTITRGADTLGTGTLGSDGTVTVVVDTSTLAPGTYPLTATYSGDDDFSSSSDDVSVTVQPRDLALNLLDINDFHGRIDANTTKFATTIERLRAQGGEQDTLFLSAGDNIGASLFASSIQQDQPTIDVLNALGLDASAIGNHEFDQGADDLRNRVEPAADWSYLAANVYDKGTTTPAFDPYDVFTVDGVRVGVIGAITQETPSLVSPDGVADLDFGDPVDAVNRVAAQLTDGDPANGEADVLVAEYHEGAGDTLADDATCAQEVAQGGVFGKIATQTSPKVAAIFTGHTHKTYACDVPVPGAPGTNRPILQTGSYGENVGQIVLTVDRTTGEVESYTQRNVARATAEDLSFPRVQQVKQITDAAIAYAARVGNQPVGTISADITTAYTGTSRDNRAAESALGDLVADALRDGVSGFADPDLGVTNPGGLRNELLYRGDTSSNPQNTDGVVTYAEANAVLPFNNTVALVQLTGVQLRAVLEQQYQTNPDGTVPSRPYLQLGLSDNVRVTADATAPAGSRITSVSIDDVPLDPNRIYTVSTLSFLAQGGDNFRAFTQGRSTDTGLLDAQLFRDYLAAATRSPDFARQQVFASNLPSTITEGQASSFTLGPDLVAPVQPNTGETLDLTSLGSPANTQVVATVGGQTVGTFPVSRGTAQIDLTVPAGAPAADYVTLTAVPSGTTVTIPLEQLAAVAVTARDVTVRHGQPIPVAVSVAGGAPAPSGTVELFEGTTSLGSGQLDVDGRVTVTLPAGSLSEGDHTVRVVYSGDPSHRSAETTLVVTVTALPAAVVRVADVHVAYGRPAKVKVVVEGPHGSTATGTVSVVDGGTVLGTGTLDRKGHVTITVAAGSLPPGSSTTAQATYSGDAGSGDASADFRIVVDKARSKTQVQVQPSAPRVGQPASVSVTVTGPDGVSATGTVRITVNGGAPVTVPLSDGQVSADIGSFASAGRANVVVEYLGSDQLMASSVTKAVKVRA